MKIRITGLPVQVEKIIEVIRGIELLDLIGISDPYPNRGDSRTVRVYIEAQLTEWCDRSWHDGNCCEGSRKQWAGTPRNQHPDEQKRIR